MGKTPDDGSALARLATSSTARPHHEPEPPAAVSLWPNGALVGGAGPTASPALRRQALRIAAGPGVASAAPDRLHLPPHLPPHPIARSGALRRGEQRAGLSRDTRAIRVRRPTSAAASRGASSTAGGEVDVTARRSR
ncbi:hypothetical protein GCM10009827_065110 [Dactylosporangium maewongense]|uniref:Uncharacterized protein n=1 Tax=Dactylosporangium maewongense TaxID=634393 RepID=A0ABP4M9G7_9ACTN